MGPNARCASAQRRAPSRMPAPFVIVLLTGVLMGLVLHLLGALNQRSAAHDDGVALMSTSATVSVDPHPSHSPGQSGAAPIADHGPAYGAGDTSALLATAPSHNHGDTACGSLLRPSGATALDVSQCADSTGVPKGVVGLGAIKIPTVADGVVPVAKPTDSPGRQRR